MDISPAGSDFGPLWLALVLALAAVNLTGLVIKRFVIPRIPALNGGNGHPPLLPAERLSDADLDRIQRIYPKLHDVSAAIVRVELATCGPDGCVNRQAQLIIAQNNTAERLGDVAEAMTNLAVVVAEMKGAASK